MLVAAVGFEPTTNRVWTEYSSQLSYAAEQRLSIISNRKKICKDFEVQIYENFSKIKKSPIILYITSEIMI